MTTNDNSRRVLYLTSMDLRRLRDVIATAREFADGSMPARVGELQSLLKTATIAPAEYLPANVVTLGSRIRIKDEETGQIREVVVSLPGDCLDCESSLSILEPVGSSVLGMKAGETFAAANGTRGGRTTVEEVLYQSVDCEWA